MKNVLIIFVMIIVATCTWQHVSADQTLHVTLQLPIKHHLGQNLLDFKEEVEQETKGEIKIKIYPSAKLYKDREVPQAVSSGAIEMGVASLTVFADKIPAVDIFYVPFMFSSVEHVRRATAPDSPIRTAIDNKVLETGARILWWQAFGGTIILSREEAIRRPEDMEGKKVRVFGKTLGEFVKTVGGEPVLISGSEQFSAYKHSVVDAGMTGLTTIRPRKLYQVMDYVSLTNLADIEFVVLINEKVWQGLTDEQRKIMTNVARRVEKELRNKIERIEAEALEFIREKMTAVEISEEELLDWRRATSSMIDTYMSTSGSLGKKLLEEARQFD